MNHNWKIVNKPTKFRLGQTIYESDDENLLKICLICNQISYLSADARWFMANTDIYGIEIINCTNYIIKNIIE